MMDSRRKVEAVIHNARRFEIGRNTASRYMVFQGKAILYAEASERARIPASNKLWMVKQVKSGDSSMGSITIVLPICRPAGLSMTMETLRIQGYH